MSKLLKVSSVLLFLAFFMNGCQSDTSEILDVQSDNQVSQSKEFIDFINTFNALEEMDEIIFNKIEESLINKNITKSEVEKYYLLHIVDDLHKEEIIQFYNEIGISSAEQFYIKRKQILTKSLPQIGMKLLKKFPQLRDRPVDEFGPITKTEASDCRTDARRNYLINAWNEGFTYAGVVYDNTMRWCKTLLNEYGQ